MTEAQPKRQPGTGNPEESGAAAGTSSDAAQGADSGRSSRLPRGSVENDEERDTLVPDPRKRVTPAPTATQISVRVAGRTDVGLVREHNEDNFLLADLGSGSREPSTFHEVSSAGLLLGVCDGMGGAAAGEVASQMAVDTILEMMTRSVPAPDRDALARALVRSVEEAGERIFEAARTDRSRRGMGTTATIATLMDKTLFVGQVGDSRAYILRGGELKQITKDQSLVNQLIEAGQLTEDEAEQFEHSNIILQALGTTEQVSVDLTFLELRSGDRLMMCSDGLSGLVHGDVIREVMIDYDDLDACGARLIELAKGAGGHDNVTVILCEFSGPGLSPPQPGDLAGYQQYPLPPDSDLAHASLSSDVPTVAPPSSGRAPAGERTSMSDALGPDESGTRPGRVFVLLILVSLLLGGFYWYAVGSESDVEPDQALGDKRELVPAAEVPGVEVVVRTDVESAELFVDGESKGGAQDGRWLLSLAPGPHKLEARAAGTTVTSSTVSVREGHPATVLLSLPEGADALGPDAAADAASGKKSETEERAEARRERRRREREANQAASTPATPSASSARDSGSAAP
ncbi:MAG TPA: Stp1/IreP family PP2C-type Ser/Thr phosphatase [Polyangiales bacterium]